MTDFNSLPGAASRIKGRTAGHDDGRCEVPVKPPSKSPTLRAILRTGIPFLLVLNTIIGLLISALFPEGTLWTKILESLVRSHTIGFTLCIIQLVIYLATRRWLARQIVLRLLIHIIGFPSGMLLGAALGEILIGQTPQWQMLGNQHGSVTLVFSLIGMGVGVLFVTGRWMMSLREQRAEQAEKAALLAQLRNLQAQVEPHFLFNTLATLDALMATDVAGAREMLSHLIRYLRASLTHARSDQTTLGEEFELLQAYLSIMAIRLPDRLSVELQCDEDCASLSFPPMLLQPLVENAIRHGIEPARDGGHIAIRAAIRDAQLILQVSDSGRGLGTSPTSGTGTGLRNIRDRLQALFGDDAGLSVTTQLPQGTLASIHIPVDQLAGQSAS